MTMILGFKSAHDPDECRAILDRYAEGGDGGVTYVTIRKACNLPIPKNHAAVPRTPGRIPATLDPRAALCTPTGGTPATPLQEPLPQTPSRRASFGVVEPEAHRSLPVSLRTDDECSLRRLVSLVNYCCEFKKDLVTRLLVKRTKGIWTDLRTEKLGANLLKELPQRGKMMPVMPVIPCRKNILEVLPHQECLSLGTGLKECIGLEALGSCDDGFGLSNSGVIRPISQGSPKQAVIRFWRVGAEGLRAVK